MLKEEQAVTAHGKQAAGAEAEEGDSAPDEEEDELWAEAIEAHNSSRATRVAKIGHIRRDEDDSMLGKFAGREHRELASGAGAAKVMRYESTGR